MSLKILETERLVIRPFDMDDVTSFHRISVSAFGADSSKSDAEALAERQSWIQWSMLSQEWYPKMYQPPYGDRAVVLKSTAALIGAVGYPPCLGPFDRFSELYETPNSGDFFTPEVGLFWVIDPDYQRRGYATEAAQAMIDHAFTHLNLQRLIATTAPSNTASIAVMVKVGMQVLHNPSPEPGWMQVVGVLNNPG